MGSIFTKIHPYFMLAAILMNIFAFQKVEKSSIKGSIGIIPKGVSKLEEESSKNKTIYLKWKNGHVPYEISDSISYAMNAIILDTIKFWNKDFASCIEWLPRHEERDYVLISKGSMCRSEIGRLRRKQLLFLNEINCNRTGDILHEMSHAVGFSHEHIRPDRNQYIKVLYRNIPYGWRNQYKRSSNWIFGKLGPYDYYSLMHYQVESPDRKKPAFVVLKKGVNESRIGQRTTLTDLDKFKIKKLYCPQKNFAII